MQTEAIEYYGRVENGVVVLEKPEELAEGTYVCVTPVKTNSTLGQRLLGVRGNNRGSTSGYGEQPRSLYPWYTEEMTMVFAADTFYYIAFLSPSDEAHEQAKAFTQNYSGKMITTEWVLTELADGLAAPAYETALCCLH